MKKRTPAHVSSLGKKAFSLVEILIAVVLLAIVAAASIPAISQYKAAIIQTTMQNDGLRLGTAAQTYFAETLERSVTLKYNPATGTFTAPEAFRMQGGNKIQAEYTLPDNELKISYATKNSFALKHPDAGTYVFDDKGNLTRSE